MPVTKTAGAGAPPKAPAAAPAAADEPPPEPDTLAVALSTLRTRRLLLLGLIDENDRKARELAGIIQLLQHQLTENLSAITAVEAITPRPT